MSLPSISLSLALALGAAPERSEALKDAATALMLPCSEEQATGKLTSVRVVDGNELNAILEKEKSKRTKADPRARFLAVTFDAAGKAMKDYRQISTAQGLTTAEAQALVGAKVCVIEY